MAVADDTIKSSRMHKHASGMLLLVPGEDVWIYLKPFNWEVSRHAKLPVAQLLPWVIIHASKCSLFQTRLGV